MRKYALLALLILIASASARTLESHSINVNINDDKSVEVVEKYTIGLQDSVNDLNLFNNISEKAQNNLDMWKGFLQEIDTYAAGKPEKLLIISSQDRGFAYITLQYEIKEFAKEIQQEGRFSIVGITIDQLKFYDSGTSAMFIPSKTTLWINYNKDYEIIETKPVASLGPYVADNKNILIGWSGPLITTEFSIKYRVEKQIIESFSIENLINAVTENPLYLIAMLIILILGIIYRKTLISLISDSFSSEEELEPPKKEL